MVEQLRPDLLQREVNVKADGVQTAFRRLRQVRAVSCAELFGNLRPGGLGNRCNLASDPASHVLNCALSLCSICPPCIGVQ